MLPEQIESDARTVAAIAAHFAGLRPTAEWLRQRAAASARGYFTPSEDDELRHLLVSYWQARAALFEVALSFRDDAQSPAETRPAAFLVAYAAAVLLVDAARFMRESFDHNDVVRAKLNEAEPIFGIPAGVYDLVQASLTNPRHVWHLYHAQHYFDAEQARLRELAAAPPLSEVMSVVDRLGHRVRVPAARYARARAKVRLRQAVQGCGRDLLWQAVYGVVKFCSSLVADIYVERGHHPALPEDVCRQLRPILRPGDVFITRKEHALTNYFLPGYWPHAALYLGDAAMLERLGIREHDHVRPRWAQLLSDDPAEACRVLEAMKDGVRIRSLCSPLKSDAVVILRPRLEAPHVGQALARGLAHEGKAYDFDFDFTRSDRLVCTEVVYRSYEGVGGMKFALNRRAGRMTLAAEDLIDMLLARDGFEPVGIYAPTFVPRLVVGEAADNVIRATRART